MYSRFNSLVRQLITSSAEHIGADTSSAVTILGLTDDGVAVDVCPAGKVDLTPRQLPLRRARL
jgi:hypothetical protein